MTELIKMYQKKYCRQPYYLDGRGFSCWREDFVLFISAKNAELKAQLTWRPVSEKPERAGTYFAEVRPYTGCESTIITTAIFDGKTFVWHDVVKWLPIPPTEATNV